MMSSAAHRNLPENKIQQLKYKARGAKVKKYNVAIVGATGAVGKTILKILEERDFPINRLLPLASSSQRNTVNFKGEKIKVQEATPSAFEGIDVALFSAWKNISKKLAPEAVKRGTIVIDNSNAFRMDPRCRWSYLR